MNDIKYEYVHGGDIYGKDGSADNYILDFSANINPLGIPNGNHCLQY